jgi:hypothetical protein
MEVLLDEWTRDQENQEASAAISLTECLGHWLNMELDDYIFKVYLGSCVQLVSLAETPQLPPSPRIWAHTRALLVSQDRRHLFATPPPLVWVKVSSPSAFFLPLVDCVSLLSDSVQYAGHGLVRQSAAMV